MLLAAIHSLRVQTHAERWVKHTDDARLATGLLLTTLLDAENGARGYLATGDADFTAPLDRARREWKGQITALRTLTIDEPEQQRRLDRLEGLIDRELDLLHRARQEHDAGASGATLLPQVLLEKDAVDAIRALMATIDQAEVALGRERQRDLAALSGWTLVLFVASAVAFLTVAGAVWWQYKGEKVEREYLEGRARLLAQIEETLHFNEQFIGILGHDLRNPLNAISMAAQLLRDGRGTPGNGGRAPVERILASVDRMTRMIDQILDLARSRLRGAFPLHPQALDLAALTRGLVDELRAAYPGRTIDVTCQGETYGSWDPDRLSQLLSNLVGNALEHGDPERPVTVRLDGTGRQAMLRVHNYGPAIPRDLLARIFDPYRQGRHSSKSKGLGLGLFISQQIARAHGGDVTVRSSDDEGTVFSVVLPRQAPVESLAPSTALS
jgi:signal transduction histidine kinase